MRKLIGITVVGLMLAFSACEQQQQDNTQSEVLEVDTVGTEYEVERTEVEKQVDVDTTTQTETIEREQESQNDQGL